MRGVERGRDRVKILQLTDVHRWPPNKRTFELDDGRVIDIDEDHYRLVGVAARGVAAG